MAPVLFMHAVVSTTLNTTSIKWMKTFRFTPGFQVLQRFRFTIKDSEVMMLLDF